MSIRRIPLLYGPITKCEIVASIIRNVTGYIGDQPERTISTLESITVNNERIEV